MSTSLWNGYREQISAGRLLRVVNFHNTPSSMATKLGEQLQALAREFETIGLEQLDDLVQSGTWNQRKRPLLLVFYEGYANHAAVATPLLEKLGMTGWFFIPTAFPSVPAPLQEEFAVAHDLGVVDEERGSGRLALTWDEIQVLSVRHVIAAHTATHEKIDAIVTADDIRREVSEPYGAILSATGKPPAATAFLYGAPVDDHPGIEQALKQTGYRFVFSNTKLQRLNRARTFQ